MKRALLVAVLLVTACTPNQMQAFIAWHEADPAGAETWLASDEGQATLDGPRPEAAVASSPKWDAVAQCESGGNWSYPPVRGGLGHLYSGGLMIWEAAWVSFGGTEFAPWAYQASRSDQIVVAERILASQGWSAWDCS